jgi:hypothetical protein
MFLSNLMYDAAFGIEAARTMALALSPVHRN